MVVGGLMATQRCGPHIRGKLSDPDIARMGQYLGTNSSPLVRRVI